MFIATNSINPFSLQRSEMYFTSAPSINISPPLGRNPAYVVARSQTSLNVNPNVSQMSSQTSLKIASLRFVLAIEPNSQQ